MESQCENGAETFSDGLRCLFLYICHDFEKFEEIPVAIVYETSTLWRIN